MARRNRCRSTRTVRTQLRVLTAASDFEGGSKTIPWGAKRTVGIGGEERSGPERVEAVEDEPAETETETGGAWGSGEEREIAALRAADIKQRVEGNESEQVELLEVVLDERVEI